MDEKYFLFAMLALVAMVLGQRWRSLRRAAEAAQTPPTQPATAKSRRRK